jgi:hypothetical protein
VVAAFLCSGRMEQLVTPPTACQANKQLVNRQPLQLTARVARYPWTAPQGR